MSSVGFGCTMEVLRVAEKGVVSDGGVAVLIF